MYKNGTIRCFCPSNKPSRSGVHRRISSIFSGKMMKVSSSAIAASILAASTAALSSSHPNSSVQELRRVKGGEMKVEKEKFAPKFDGLKFIETLVTAHR